MGSTSTSRERGITDRDFFARELGVEIVECATIKSVFYAAARWKAQDGTVVGPVALIVHLQRSAGWCTHKTIDEDMGASADRAPAKVLDALAPTDNEHALEWRARCRKALERRDAAKAIKPGDKLRFAHEIEFRDGTRAQGFTFVAKPSTFRTDSGRMVLITGWADRLFEKAA